jgi:hypothetical protein
VSRWNGQSPKVLNELAPAAWHRFSPVSSL